MNRSPSAILDVRQRAMLLEMGVRVWLPSEEKVQAPTLVLSVRSEPPLRLPVVTAPPSTSAPVRYTIANLPAKDEAFDWVLIGESCTGESEKLLSNMLKAIAGNAFVAQMTAAGDDATGVQDQILQLTAKVVVALGPHAAKAILGDSSADAPFGKLRHATHAVAGSVAKVIVTYHPIQLLRHAPAKAQVWSDLKRVMKELR